MSLPTRADVLAEADRRLLEAHPGVELPLDPHTDDHESLVAAHTELVDRVAGEWANGVFVQHFPEVGYIDPNHPGDADLFDYWLDLRNQIRDDAAARYITAPVQIDVEVTSNSPIPTDHGERVNWINAAGDVDTVSHIIEAQQAVLRQHLAALTLFMGTLEAPNEAAATPDFVGAVMGLVVQDMKAQFDAFVKLVPYAEEIMTVANTLLDTAEQASEASAAMAMHDFEQRHLANIASVDHGLETRRHLLIAATKEIVQAAMAAQATPDDLYEYWTMHAGLRAAYTDALQHLELNDRDAWYRHLNDCWLRNATTGKEKEEVDAHVLLRIEPDFSVREARIVGVGGTKLLRGLQRNAGDFNGSAPVDLMELPIPRRIVLLTGQGEGFTAVLRLDGDGNLDGTHNDAIDGDWQTLHETIKGLAPGWAMVGDVKTDD